MSDRDDILGKIPNGTFMYCMTCERVYRHGQQKQIMDEELEVMEMCPYENCDGDTVIGGKEWTWVLSCRPDYPEVPVVGKEYPLR
jgi:hypothetical protein